ncbi:MAG: phosphotransferase family protein [Candidatus Hydrogenedentes bacterium]|nr:phosphotransferase family protein [Candidatus Hydrogenedentota bacterium]
MMDEPKPIREGEELDLATLETYLKDTVKELSGAVSLKQFPGGFSNLTYSLTVGDRDLILRRPPFGSKVKSAHDMGREYRVLHALHPVYPAAPRPLLLCNDTDVMGCPFYVMERIKGVILRGKKPAGFSTSPEETGVICKSLIKNLADLHAIDYEKIGLGDLRKEGSYVQRQVEGWIKRYGDSQTDEIAAIDEVAKWCHAHMPADSEAALIHNDYKFDNVVLAADDLSRIIGVLDWEMCTIGDPLMDLGTSLGYWMEPRDTTIGVVQCFMTTEPGAPTRAEVADHYAALTGRNVSNMQFYYVFALYKLAVIVQQIYFRYKKGLTKDERFAPLIFMVGALGATGLNCIESGEI